MSASLSRPGAVDWNYRVSGQRLVIVKAKNVGARKVAVLDVLTDLPFAMEVQDEDLLEKLAAEKEVLVDLQVYTSADVQGVEADFISFFEALDVDQSIEDFIKAYWVYPAKIRFMLNHIEKP